MSDSSFFSRWQHRREQVALEKEQEKVQLVDDKGNTSQEDISSTPSQAEDIPLEQEEKLLTEADLPDPNSIGIGGSFSQFMAKNVDPLAKKNALRALWKQPHFNEIDGLLEYGLDYSNQPKLSKLESAELVKKVFRNLLDDEQTGDEKQNALTQTQTKDVNQQQELTTADKARETDSTRLVAEEANNQELVDEAIASQQHKI